MSCLKSNGASANNYFISNSLEKFNWDHKEFLLDTALMATV